METFTLDEKIYAAFDETSSPDWDQKNLYDASPDGLSGKKEGFYCANWLMPFKIPFVLNHVEFSPSEYPTCIESDNFDCATCHFFMRNSCPILLDQENLELTRKGFEIYQKLVYWPRGESYNLFEAAQKELLAHGKPLHFQLLSKILIKRYPNLGITDRKLHKILRLNPIFFVNLEDGVFQAIPGIYKSDESPLSIIFGSLFD